MLFGSWQGCSFRGKSDYPFSTWVATIRRHPGNGEDDGEMDETGVIQMACHVVTGRLDLF